MDLVRKIQKSSLIVLFPLAALSAFLEWKKLPLSVLIGGALGLLNLRGLAWGVHGLLGTEKATPRMLFFSQFRIIMLFFVLAANYLSQTCQCLRHTSRLYSSLHHGHNRGAEVRQGS